MTIIKKNDFVEIEFTGKSNNEIFDTTNPKEAKSLGLNTNVKPVIVCVGREMILKSLDKQLEGKKIGKNYSVHLTPEQAFGKRNPSLIKIIPLRVFKQQNTMPQPGMVFQFDNQFAKIISVSGGRVTADFNHQLAGKEVDYYFKINKINAIQDFFFRKRFEFELKDKKVIFKESKLKPIIEVFKDKFKDISGLDIEVAEKKISEKPLDKKNSN